MAGPAVTQPAFLVVFPLHQHIKPSYFLLTKGSCSNLNFPIFLPEAKQDGVSKSYRNALIKNEN